MLSPDGDLCVLPPEGCLVTPAGGDVTDLPEREAPDLTPLEEGGLTILPPGTDLVRGPLKIVRSLLGTPVETIPLLSLTPMPPKVLPRNLATGSMRNTR